MLQARALFLAVAANAMGSACWESTVQPPAASWLQCLIAENALEPLLHLVAGGEGHCHWSADRKAGQPPLAK